MVQPTLRQARAAAIPRSGPARGRTAHVPLGPRARVAPPLVTVPRPRTRAALPLGATGTGHRAARNGVTAAGSGCGGRPFKTLWGPAGLFGPGPPGVRVRIFAVSPEDRGVRVPVRREQAAACPRLPAGAPGREHRTAGTCWSERGPVQRRRAGYPPGLGPGLEPVPGRPPVGATASGRPPAALPAALPALWRRTATQSF